MLGLEFNYLAVLVAGLSSLALGFLWYGPLFGQAWMRYIGKTEEELKADFSPIVHLWSLLLALGMAFILALFMSWGGIDDLLPGLLVGLLAGIGFTFVPFAVNNLYERKPFGLILINSLYHVVLLAIMGAIIGVW